MRNSTRLLVIGSMVAALTVLIHLLRHVIQRISSIINSKLSIFEEEQDRGCMELSKWSD